MALASRRFVAPAAPPRYQPDNANIEVYSDNEDGTRAGVIDIEAVSALSESAPTSVYRDRDLDGGKAKAKEMEKTKLKELKKKKKAQLRMREAVLNSGAGGGGPSGVKAEPESPLRSTAILADPNAGVPAPLMRVGDEMIPADEQQDRDAAGRRVRATTSGMDTDMTRESEEVNAAHAINLSESESEDEEEDMEGDFVFVDGNDNPEDKLFTFQFPSNMPKFVAPAPPPDADADADGDVAMASAELKPETKPAATHLKKRRNPTAPPPEGRIGTLVVMKSGKVKMVMGEGANAIVMNVSRQKHSSSTFNKSQRSGTACSIH
jgi:DNA-directed RNA polymerase III subunit RPC4